jgi:hypothetical protein
LQICALAEGARKRTEFPINNFTPDHQTALATRQHTNAEFVLENPDAASLPCARQPLCAHEQRGSIWIHSLRLAPPPFVARRSHPPAAAEALMDRERWRGPGSTPGTMPPPPPRGTQ